MFTVLWRHPVWQRSPQLRAEQPEQATALPNGGTGTFQGKDHRPKALVPWLCSQPLRTSHPPDVANYAGARQKWSFPACKSKNKHAPSHKVELPFPCAKSTPAGIRSTKGHVNWQLWPKQKFKKAPKPKDVFNSLNKKQSSWNSATISCFQLKIKLKKYPGLYTNNNLIYKLERKSDVN